jgi:hypothetical protein
MVACVEMRDSKGRFVPTDNSEISFTAPTGWRILGWGNGDPAFQYVERPVVSGKSANDNVCTPALDKDADTISVHVFNGLAQVVLQKISPEL